MEVALDWGLRQDIYKFGERREPIRQIRNYSELERRISFRIVTQLFDTIRPLQE